MRDMARATFEAGGHRGNDPFGYRTVRDGAGRVAHPRRLEIVSAEAEVIRRVFAQLARSSYSDAAHVLNREGVRHRTSRAWSVSAIKDLYRRREVYIGNVTSKRGVEIRPGTHPPILSTATTFGPAGKCGAITYVRCPRAAARFAMATATSFCATRSGSRPK